MQCEMEDTISRGWAKQVLLLVLRFHATFLTEFRHWYTGIWCECHWCRRRKQWGNQFLPQWSRPAIWYQSQWRSNLCCWFSWLWGSKWVYRKQCVTALDVMFVTMWEKLLTMASATWSTFYLWLHRSCARKRSWQKALGCKKLLFRERILEASKFISGSSFSGPGNEDSRCLSWLF